MSSPDAPATATLSLPGDFRATAINSLTDLAGTDGCTTRASGTEAISVIGAKSATGSYSSFLYKAALMACVPALPIIITEPSAGARAVEAAAKIPFRLGGF